MNKKILVIIYAIFLCAGCTKAQDVSEKLDYYIKNKPQFSGAIFVSKNGSMIFEKAYGFASVEFKVANTPNTIFPIASNTKPFTALAIMMLHENNKLKLDDKLSTYLPNVHDSVTIHHLLTHTSGIINYYKYWDSFNAAKSDSERLKAIKEWPLEFVPGTKYSYSNTNYYLLALVIEKLSGQPYEEFLSKNVFSYIGMQKTGSLRQGNIIEGKAYGYQSIDNKLQNAPSIINLPTLLGSGDLYSTASNVGTFIDALFAGKLINASNLNLLTKAHVKTTADGERAHAYGWFIDKTLGRVVAYYSGALVGYLSKIMHFVDDKITVVILTNREDDAQFSEICEDIPGILFDNLAEMLIIK